MRKVILLFSMVTLIVLYVNKPLFFEEEVTFKTKEKRAEEVQFAQSVGEPITRGEINSFIRVWSDYSRSWVSNIGVKQLSLTTSAEADRKTPYIVKAWIIRKGWEVDRFFYVEERLKAIVKSLEAEDRAKKTMDIIEKQMRLTGQANENMMKVLDIQKSLTNIELVSKEEMDLVRPVWKEVYEVLNNVEK